MIDKKTLIEQYHGKKLSLRAVGELHGVSQSTICRWLKKMKIRARNSGELNVGRPSGATGKNWKLSDKAKQNHSKSLLGKKKTLRHRINMGMSHKGLLAKEKNPNWRGGISKENEIIRKSFTYKLWRETIFERDNYTCVLCGKNGVELNADHIKPFAYYPELRFKVTNGRTLCVPCHKATDNYAGRGRIYELA